MKLSPRSLAHALLAPLMLVAILALAGCATDDRPPRGTRGRTPKAQAVPNLVGQETFFAGRILAEVRVGALAGFDRGGDGGSGGRGGDGGSRPRRGRGSGGFSMGGMGMGGGAGRPEGGGPGAGPGGDEGLRRGARPELAAHTPPVAIHLRFTNTGAASVDLRIVDFLSPLGNFVVNPSQLKLEPGQSLEVEPMASRLAGEVTSGEISLALRLGDETETKVVSLAPEPPKPSTDTP